MIWRGGDSIGYGNCSLINWTPLKFILSSTSRNLRVFFGYTKDVYLFHFSSRSGG